MRKKHCGNILRQENCTAIVAGRRVLPPMKGLKGVQVCLVSVCLAAAISCDGRSYQWRLDDRLLREVGQMIESRESKPLEDSDIARLVEILHCIYIHEIDLPKPHILAYRKAALLLIDNGRESLPELLSVLEESPEDVLTILRDRVGLNVELADVRDVYCDEVKYQAIRCASVILEEPFGLESWMDKEGRPDVVASWRERLQATISEGNNAKTTY